MAWTPPRRAELRARVQVLGRSPTSKNVGGVIRRGWDVVVPDRMARLLPQRGGDAVIADRVAGVSIWTMDVPACSAIRAIGDGAGMRVQDVRDPRRQLAIKSCLDLEGRDRWRTLTLELVADDGGEG